MGGQNKKKANNKDTLINVSNIILPLCYGIQGCVTSSKKDEEFPRKKLKKAGI